MLWYEYSKSIQNETGTRDGLSDGMAYWMVEGDVQNREHLSGLSDRGGKTEIWVLRVVM